MGRLTACLPADFNLDRIVHYSVWPDSGMAGIGSSARWRAGNDGIRESEGTIVINGGNIRAKGQDNASAIGGTRASDIEFRPPTAVRSTTAGRAAASPSMAALSVPNPLPCR